MDIVENIPVASCSQDNGAQLVVVKNHSGQILDSGQRTMIHNLYATYQNQEIGKAENVKLTAQSLGVSETIVWNIVWEKERTGTLVSPSKKRKRKCAYDKLDELQKTALRRVVHQFFLANDPPTLDKILVEVERCEVLPPMSRSTLSKTLGKLGFSWETRSRNHLLIERPDLILWRRTYLRNIRKFRLEERKIYYLDETWVNAGHTKSKIWKDKSVTSASDAFLKGLSTGLKEPSGKGKRLIILHIGNEDGFVENGLLCFESKKTGDYHEEMNSTVFEDWIRRTLPLLEPNCVIVMDNAPYHSRKTEKIPTFQWNKPQMIEWLKEKGIPAEHDVLKVELFDRIKEHLKSEQICSSYVVDELVKSTGREILRLPPYHCKFNPIELVWAQVKGYVAANNKTFKFADMKILFQDALSQVTPEKWAECVKHAIKEEDFIYPVDNHTENMQLEFTVNTGSSDEEI